MTLTGFFAKHGRGTDQAARILVWEQMLRQVMFLLHEAHRRVSTTERQRELRGIDGWWRSNKKVRLNGKLCLVPSEEAISEALCREMEAIQREIVLQIFPKSTDPSMASIDTLQVCPEQPRRIASGIGKKAKPTDIRFYRIGSAVLDLRVEAKVLLSENDIKKAYLSKNGIKRFSDARDPYTEQEIGGMLAYVVTDDRLIWLGRIEGAMRASVPAISTFKHGIQAATEETLFCSVPYAVAGPRNEVLVFHVVLEFACEPDAR